MIGCGALSRCKGETLMTDASSISSKRRRRWFQFSLRTLLIAVTLAAGLLVACCSIVLSLNY